MAAAGGGDAGGTSTRAAPAAAAEGSAPPHAPGGLLRALPELPLSRITMYEQLPAHTSSRSQSAPPCTPLPFSRPCTPSRAFVQVRAARV